MAIRPIDEYSGKVATDTNYPDGKAQNITSPGDGTGTPWEAKLVNDVFGFQQFLTSKAGITPSGTPESATTSQYFEALWNLLNVRSITHNMVSNADYSLTADQNLCLRVVITDTTPVLTQGRNIVVDGAERFIYFENQTLWTLTVKTSGGTGYAVLPGARHVLRNDGTDVYESLITLAGQNTGFKNFIINGDLSVQQYFADIDAAPAAASNQVYYIDRQKAVTSGAAVTIQRLSDTVAGRQVRTLKYVTSTTGTYSFGSLIRQNEYHAGETITISVWIRSNNANARIVVFDSVTSVASTPHSGGGEWEKLTLTFTVSSAASYLDIYIRIQGTSGSAPITSGDYIEYTMHQLEKGSVATPFEQRDSGLEMTLAQRFYESFGPFYYYATGVDYSIPLSYKVKKRIAVPPTFTLYSGSGVTVTAVSYQKEYSSIKVTGPQGNMAAYRATIDAEL